MLAFIHTAVVAIGRALVDVGSLLFCLQQRVAQAHADRARVEAQLFHGRRYHLSSKNDDDVPLVG
jgi:hypothetical protein